MVAEGLRAIHAPVWVIFAAVFGLYFLTAGWWMLNGYTRELFGSPLPHMGRIHKVVYNFHTGLPVKNMKTSGDKRHLKRVAADSRRATPEGETVLWHKWPRWARALRNNLILFSWLLTSCCMAIAPADTVRAIIWFTVIMLVLAVFLIVRKKREQYRKSHPVSRSAMARTKPAKKILAADDTTVGDTPKLEDEKVPELSGVPATVLANLLSSHMGCSTAELLNRLRLDPDGGSIVLPDTFGALLKQREPIEELIRAHTDGKVSFSWKTTMTPRTLYWLPVIEPTLPSLVRFRDYLREIERLGPREFGIGAIAGGDLFSLSHNGDNPFWCRFAGSGTGKSVAFLVKAAQICHKDPEAELYCVDTKQVSFKHLRGIPGVHIYDNPVSEMDRIYRVWYELYGIMRDRYSAVREGRAKLSDFHDIWMLVDEGNDLGASMKSHWKNAMGESTASPAVWGEAVGPLIRQGREANMFGEWMFQDLRDQAMGGESLKFGFNVFGAAGFLPQQFARTVGNPAEECIEGPGKILMCRGKKRTWVQGFVDDPEWLHEYALENRKGMMAA